MPLHYHRTQLSTIVNGDCRAARPASPPNQRMNPTLPFLNQHSLWKARGSNIPPFVRLTRKAGCPLRRWAEMGRVIVNTQKWCEFTGLAQWYEFTGKLPMV